MNEYELAAHKNLVASKHVRELEDVMAASPQMQRDREFVARAAAIVRVPTVPMPINPRGSVVPRHMAVFDERLSEVAEREPRYLGNVVTRIRGDR